MNSWDRDTRDDASLRADVSVVVQSVLRPEEVDRWNLCWLSSHEPPAADYSQEGHLPEDGSNVLWIEIVAQGEEWWFGTWDSYSDWHRFLAAFAGELSAWVSETGFAWGEWREATVPGR